MKSSRARAAARAEGAREGARRAIGAIFCGHLCPTWRETLFLKFTDRIIDTIEFSLRLETNIDISVGLWCNDIRAFTTFDDSDIDRGADSIVAELMKAYNPFCQLVDSRTSILRVDTSMRRNTRSVQMVIRNTAAFLDHVACFTCCFDDDDMFRMLGNLSQCWPGIA